MIALLRRLDRSLARWTRRRAKAAESSRRGYSSNVFLDPARKQGYIVRSLPTENTSEDTRALLPRHSRLFYRCCVQLHVHLR